MNEVLTVQETQVKDPLEKLRSFLRLAQERFKLAAEAESENRKQSLDDLEFRAGKQWPSNMQTQRSLDGRPCLTINRLPPIIRQVTNEQRQQRPSIQVNPVGDGATQDTAEVEQGIIRHIETISDAEIAYDTATESMVTIGVGWWEIVTEFIEGTFDQEIKIKRIKNPFIIYDDPSCVEPCSEDSMWRFKVEDVPIEEYRNLYKASEAASMVDFESVGDQAPDWATKDTIRVAMYWHVEQKQRTLCLLQDGSNGWEDELTPEGRAQIVQRRTALDRRVYCSKINAIEVLNENDEGYDPEYFGQLWPGKWIPSVPVFGDDLDINGRRYLAGIVRDAKDPQRMYNYWNSSATETIALAPKAPFVGAKGIFKGVETQWQAANVRNFSYLEFDPQDIHGNAAQPPQRQIYEPPIAAMSQMIRQSDNDLKATTGIYDASLGERGPEQSGKAILERKKQGDVATLHFVDNLSRAMRHTGRMLIDLIPKVYDAPRIQRVINPDNSVDHVIIHNQQEQAAQGLVSEAVKHIYDIGVGTYDVTVSVGPSYQTKRQESVAAQMALVSAYPAVMPIIGDILIGNMDWPGHKEMADRLKKAVPQQFLDNEDNDPAIQLQQTQAQLQQMAQQHEMLVKALDHATEIIKTDGLKYQSQAQITAMELASKERIAAFQTQAELIQTEAKINADRAQTLLQTEIGRIEGLIDRIHEHSVLAHEHENATAQADQAAELTPIPAEGASE